MGDTGRFVGMGSGEDTVRPGTAGEAFENREVPLLGGLPSVNCTMLAKRNWARTTRLVCRLGPRLCMCDSRLCDEAQRRAVDVDVGKKARQTMKQESATPPGGRFNVEAVCGRMTKASPKEKGPVCAVDELSHGSRRAATLVDTVSVGRRMGRMRVNKIFAITRRFWRRGRGVFVCASLDINQAKGQRAGRDAGRKLRCRLNIGDDLDNANKLGSCVFRSPVSTTSRVRYQYEYKEISNHFEPVRVSLD